MGEMYKFCGNRGKICNLHHWLRENGRPWSSCTSICYFCILLCFNGTDYFQFKRDQLKMISDHIAFAWTYMSHCENLIWKLQSYPLSSFGQKVQNVSH